MHQWKARFFVSFFGTQVEMSLTLMFFSPKNKVSQNGLWKQCNPTIFQCLGGPSLLLTNRRLKVTVLCDLLKVNGRKDSYNALKSQAPSTGRRLSFMTPMKGNDGKDSLTLKHPAKPSTNYRIIIHYCNYWLYNHIIIDFFPDLCEKKWAVSPTWAVSCSEAGLSKCRSCDGRSSFGADQVGNTKEWNSC